MIPTNQKMAAARYVVTCKLPFFRQAACSLVLIPTPGLGTCAMSQDGRLFYDPAYIEAKEVPALAFVYAHELLHFLRNHHRQAKAAGIQPGTTLARLANIAQDFEINDDLIACGLPIDDGITAEQFGLESGSTWQAYFVALRKMLEDENHPQHSAVKAMTGGDRSEPKPGRGDCGSVSGDPHPGEPAYDPGATGGPQSVKGRSESEAARVRMQAAKNVLQSSQGCGKGAGRFRRWASDMVSPPKVNWRAKLARTVRNATAWVSGSGDYTYRRASRKQAAFGFGVGRVILPKMRRAVPRIWVVLDTSGSMSNKDIGDSLTEIAGIISAQPGADVTFLSGDCAVSEVVKVRSIEHAKKHVSGGGGTDFRPAFVLASQAPKWERPNILVYCTDGMGPAPVYPPHGITTIWCLVGPYRKSPASWGETIDLGAAA